MAARMKALVDKLLTDVSLGLFQELTSFGAERLLTPMKVKQSSGLVGKYKANYLRVHANAMGGRGEAPRVNLMVPDVTTAYVIDNHGLEELVTKDDYDNWELPFDAEKDKTLGLTYANLVAKEVALSSALASTATLTQYTTLSGDTQFSDLENSNPISVIDTGRQAVRDGCGFYPDTAFMEAKVYEKLRIHPQIWDRAGFKYNQSGQLSLDNLATVLNVKRLVVMESVYNSASQGQTDVIAPIWGKHMWFGVLPQNPSLKMKTGGFHITKQNEESRQVWKYSVNNPPGSTAVLCTDNYDMLIADALAFYFVQNAVA